MTIADDTNRNNLLDQEEYVIFLNWLLNGAFDGLTFDELPYRYRNLYNDLEEGGGIDISGSKPDTMPTTEQGIFLQHLCDEAKKLFTDTDPPSVPVMTRSPRIGDESCTDETVDERDCLIDLTFADSDRDSKLTEEEYVRFVNKVSDDNYKGLNFGELPGNLKDTFYSLASYGVIDIIGSRPEHNPSDSQESFLIDVCCQTDLALKNPTQPTTGPPPSSPPVSNPFNCDDSIPRQKCNIYVSIVDVNKDDFLNKVEYVRFLDRLVGDDTYDNVFFNDLPENLIANFDKFADGDKINIYGTKPGQKASSSQDEKLDAFCCETDYAVENPGTLAPVTPTQSPVPVTPSPTPTTPAKLVEVFNSFIISNTKGINANRLVPGNPNRDGLDGAYDKFSSNSVSSLSQIRSSSFSLRRSLATMFEPNSAKITTILDSDCPAQVDTRATCQTVFASFKVTVRNQDIEGLSERYTSATQKDIENGALQTALTDEDPLSSLKVVDASYPAIYEPSSVPTPAPTPAPAPAKKSSPAGPIVGGLFAVVIILVIGWYIKKNGIKGMPWSNKSNAYGKQENEVKQSLFAKFMVFISKLANKNDDRKTKREEDNDDDSDIIDDYISDDSDSSDEDNENAFGTFGVEQKNSFEKERLEEKQGTKNFFGFGKLRKQDTDDSDNFGVGSDYSNSTKDGADFSNYKFDDPSASEKSYLKDGTSYKFDSTMSPEWGNFGGSEQWGASGDSSEVGKNFFVSSTFANQDSKSGKEYAQPLEGDGAESSSESSYESSEDTTYESDADSNLRKDVYSSSSTDNENTSAYTSTGESVDNEGGWGVNAEIVPQESNTSSAFGEGLTQQGSDDIDNEEESGADYDEDTGSDDESSYSGSSDISEDSRSTVTSTSDERRKRKEYRAQVVSLVGLVIPEQIDKVDAMMEQFKGREAELISTLQTMQERSAAQRARAAVHKSKSIPSREETRADGSYAGANTAVVGASEGSAAGTAAIAAASLPIPAGGFEEVDDQGEPEEETEFGDEQAFPSNSTFPEDAGRGSFYSDDLGDDLDQSSEGSESYDDGSFAEDSGTKDSRSHTSQERSESFDEESFTEFTEEILDETEGDNDEELTDTEEVISLSHEAEQSDIWK